MKGRNERMFEKFKNKVSQHSRKLAAAVAGGAVMTSGSITAFAADTTVSGTGTTAEAVNAAKELMNIVTGVLNITNIVAILGAGLTSILGLFLAWWGARKLVKMVMSVFKKGKISL